MKSLIFTNIASKASNNLIFASPKIIIISGKYYFGCEDETFLTNFQHCQKICLAVLCVISLVTLLFCFTRVSFVCSAFPHPSFPSYVYYFWSVSTQNTAVIKKDTIFWPFRDIIIQDHHGHMTSSTSVMPIKSVRY